MTDQERYLFDLQGYLVIPNALSAGQLATLNAALDERIEREMAPETSTHRFSALLSWGQPYVDLLDNPRVEPHLTEILGELFRIDHIYLDVIRSGLSPIGATLHGGGTPFHRINFYDFRNGRMYSGLFVVAYNLADVGPEDGGFACVPGSHKSNYPLPSEWRDLTERQPFVERITGPAGTAVLFTEALTHGPLPWSGKSERRTLFYKYNHHGAAWSAGYPVAGGLSVTERQRRILQPPDARYPRRPPAIRSESSGLRRAMPGYAWVRHATPTPALRSASTPDSLAGGGRDAQQDTVTERHRGALLVRSLRGIPCLPYPTSPFPAAPRTCSGRSRSPSPPATARP